MNDPFIFIGLEIFTGLCALPLLIAAVHRLLLLTLFLKKQKNLLEPEPFSVWPSVVMQLPVYNEAAVIVRLLRAVAQIEYPRGQCEVQILDDSTDETTELIRQEMKLLEESGFRVTHLRRQVRTGFKAGALRHGTSAEFVAILDADFLPAPDFLQQTLAHFTEARIGMVQARWGHLNAHENRLTRLQSILLDSHHLIEQTLRSRHDLFFNFNGTSGVWRRTCIEDAGNWTADTLTEDLDLSLRAYQRGWKFRYLRDYVVPGEIPPTFSAFLQQQRRWTCGCAQTFLKQAGSLWSSSLSWRQQLDTFCYLMGSFSGLCFALIFALTCPWWAFYSLSFVPVFTLTSLFTASLILFYTVGLYLNGTRWWQIPVYIVGLLILGAITCPFYAWAALRSWGSRSLEFQRTPKYGKVVLE
jgi:cellulose synthase/poly-beta-1,6-N-acetylglucosamine synthase-like glycosyltransferase